MESATQHKSSRKHIPSQRLCEAQDSSSSSSSSKKRTLEVEVDDLPPASRCPYTPTPEDDEDDTTVGVENSNLVEEAVEEVREPEGDEDDVLADQSEASLLC